MTTSTWHARQVNDSMYELYKAETIPSIQVIFFHGLPLGDFLEPHLTTWESGDGSCIWPQSWLVEKFPDANIFSVSYSECLRKASVNSFDMCNLGENLISDLIGQLATCPIVLVGHCIGGLVIKQLCLQAHDNLHMASPSEKAKLGTFVDNVRGIFFYGTPHHGSSNLAEVAEKMGSPLFEYVRILSAQTARMNSRFDQLGRLHPNWQIRGLGESTSTELECGEKALVVGEASSRTGESFRVLSEDHYSICKPKKKSSTSFTALVQVLDSIMTEEIKKRIEEDRAREQAQPRNLEHLPKKVVGIESRLEELKSKLENFTMLGLVGMGGVGKTTLAKAIFNELSLNFDYSCFVPDVKSNIKGTVDEAKQAMWKRMHYKGGKVGKEDDWSTLGGKRLLLVLDDIADDRDITILSELAKDCSPESSFIATSRNHELLEHLEVSGEVSGKVHEVLFLDESDSKELFRSHAFPDGAFIPLNLVDVMEDVVKKCGGLPLALEVLGRYLIKKSDKYWEQVLQALDKGEAVTPIRRLRVALRLSYDDLEETEKKMFLDATTFFNNGQYLLGEAKAAWRKAYETHCETICWQTLVDRSLVNDVKDDERIQVHEQVQSLGRMIVAQCNEHGPCKEWECNKHGPRRVWDEQLALKLLQTPNQVKDQEFHSLRIESSSQVHIASQALPKLRELRFLDIRQSVVIDGSQEDDSSFDKLLVLNCVGLPIFNFGFRSSLVVLKLSLPDVEELPTSIRQLSSLEIFVILNAEKLKSLDEIGHFSLLESLELKYCDSLQKIPETFGELSKLKNLEFFECSSLCALPKCFGDLKDLVTLAFNHCRELKTLPVSFGDLLSLRKLYFTDCCLESLPESFGKLSSLIELELIDCKQMWSLIPFGQLTELQYLKIGKEYEFGEMDSMPGSMANLGALCHLVVDSVSAKSIPDDINLESLQTLELIMLPYVKVLPAWLGNIGVIPLALSRKVFEKQKGCFSLTYEEDAISPKNMVRLLHSFAMKKVKKADYKGALEDLCPGNLGEMKPKWEGFLLQEKGILKHRTGDLYGALEDLKAALELFCNGNNLNYAYDCYKHRGFVNSSLGHHDDAQNDGTMALKILSRYGLRSVCSPSLGDEVVSYMHFRLKGLKEIKEERKVSPHSEVMESVRVGDFSTALATWNDFNARVSGYSNQVYFFQERGVLKRMAGDWQGALEDLTAALEIDEDDYECLKHRGYVKHLMGNNDGARLDASKCKTFKCADHKTVNLGARPVEFLEFHLT